MRPTKIHLLLKAVNEHVVRKDLDVTVRFDIIAIHYTKQNIDIEHIEEAFYYF